MTARMKLQSARNALRDANLQIVGLRARLLDNDVQRAIAEHLLETYANDSEEYNLIISRVIGKNRADRIALRVAIAKIEATINTLAQAVTDAVIEACKPEHSESHVEIARGLTNGY
jgi:hypothetical protein